MWRVFEPPGSAGRCFWTLILAAALVRGFWVNISSNLTFNAPWTIGEWLINYAGGFTRRGLPGAVIFYSTHFLGLAPWVLAVLVSIFCWLILALLLWLICRNRFRTLFLFSPFVMLSPLIGEYLIRKDCFNLALLAISMLIAGSIASAGLSARIIRLVLINALGSIAILSHESYIFYAFPSLIFILQGLPYVRSLKARLGGLIALSCMLSPMLVVTALCLYFHGDVATAEAIQKSWLIFSNRYPSIFPEEPMGAIGAIGWSSAYGLYYTNKFILFELANGFIWRPIALLISIFVVAKIVVSSFAVKEGQSAAFRKKVSQIFVVNLLFMAPIFMIGHDYGRWLFMIVVSTILVSSLLQFEPEPKFSPVAPANLNLVRAQSSVSFATLGGLFFGIPAYWNSWNLAWAAQTSWLGYLILPFSNALHIKFMAIYAIFLAAFLAFIRRIYIPRF